MSAEGSANILGRSALLQPNSTVIVLVLKTLFRLSSLYNLVVLLSASPLYHCFLSHIIRQKQKKSFGEVKTAGEQRGKAEWESRGREQSWRAKQESRVGFQSRIAERDCKVGLQSRIAERENRAEEQR